MSYMKHLLVTHVEEVESLLGCRMGQTTNSFMIKKDPGLKLAPSELVDRMLSWELIHSFVETTYTEDPKKVQGTSARIALKLSTLVTLPAPKGTGISRSCG